MPGKFSFDGPPKATNRPIYVGDDRDVYLTLSETDVDYSTGHTFRAEIAANRLPATDEVAAFTVTAVGPRELLAHLPASESAKLGPLLDPATGTPEYDDRGEPTGFALAEWDLEVTNTTTTPPRVVTLLSGVVKIEGDVSRA